MRAGGINWLAVAASAVAIYVLGFLIYGMAIPEETFMTMSGITEAEKATAMSRMIYGPLMPILTSVFLAVLFVWGQVATISTGVRWAAAVAFASAIPTMLYGWVYGGLDTNMTMIDCAHLFLGHATAGAILGGWR